MAAELLAFPQIPAAGVFTLRERIELSRFGTHLAQLGLYLSAPVALDGEYEYFRVEHPSGRAIYVWREAGVAEFTVAEVDDVQDILVPLGSAASVHDVVAIIASGFGSAAA